MKTAFVAAAVAATLGLGSVSAFAQDHRDNRQATWQHQRADHGRAGWNHRGYYAAPRYYGHGYRNDNGDVVGALVLGALTGAVLGQASNGYAYSAPPAYYAPPAGYYAPPATYYAPPATYYTPNYGYYGN